MNYLHHLIKQLILVEWLRMETHNQRSWVWIPTDTRGSLFTLICCNKCIGWFKNQKGHACYYKQKLTHFGHKLCSCREFESRHRILDGHFSQTYLFFVKFVMCLKRRKQNEKEAGVGPFLNCVLTVTNFEVVNLEADLNDDPRKISTENDRIRVRMASSFVSSEAG